MERSCGGRRRCTRAHNAARTKRGLSNRPDGLFNWPSRSSRVPGSAAAARAIGRNRTLPGRGAGQKLPAGVDIRWMQAHALPPGVGLRPGPPVRRGLGRESSRTESTPWRRGYKTRVKIVWLCITSADSREMEWREGECSVRCPLGLILPAIPALTVMAAKPSSGGRVHRRKRKGSGTEFAASNLQADVRDHPQCGQDPSCSRWRSCPWHFRSWVFC